MAADSIARPVALVTGASRTIGIGAAIVLALAEAGWDVAVTYWRPYDASMPWGSTPGETEAICRQAQAAGAHTLAVEADLALVETAARLFDEVTAGLGSISALVMAHAQSVDSDILTTSVASFDLHFAVNARASWLLVRELGRRFCGPHGSGRILAITSDHTAGHLPYGASKGALDRIVLAAAYEFRTLGITANVINPGPTDTGWMTPDLYDDVRRATPLGRVGQPQDCANLVRFLCSPAGGWINGQLLYSNGGVK